MMFCFYSFVFNFVLKLVWEAVIMRAQSPIEYMFMIAAMLLIVLVTVKFLHDPTKGHIVTTGKQISSSEIMFRVETIVQKYNNTEWWEVWEDTYLSCVGGNVSECEKIVEAYSGG